MTFDDSNQTPPPPSPLSAAPPAGAQVGYSASSAPLAPAPALEGDKTFLATWLLSLLVGYFGVDRFYLGKIGTGILKLVTIGGLGVWWLVDLILVLTGSARDARGQALSGYQQHRKVAWIVTGAVVLFGVVLNIVNANAASDSSAPDRPAAVAPASEPASEPAEEPADEPAAAEPAEAAPAEAEAPAKEPAPPAEPAVPVEYASALTKAEQYSDIMHMSKAGIYDQLTSEYGEQFSAEAAQYAVDTMTADWNANALAKAKDYQNTMAMSPDAIHDQLTSEYGEKFTAAEADYAIAHLND